MQVGQVILHEPDPGERKTFVAEGENIIEKETETVESKDDVAMRAELLANEPIYLDCAPGSSKDIRLEIKNLYNTY